LTARLSRWLEHVLDWRLRGPGIWLYRSTGGAIARIWKVDLLLLTTSGRRTGKRRTVVLPFISDGASLLVVGANAGLPPNHDWFHNQQGNPNVRVEIGNESSNRRAAILSPEQAAIFWPRIVERLPSYALYPQRTTRSLPIVRLSPAEALA
jgi:deazaflavin-dependent oxidoreductase (nitroreductase family)